VNGRDGINQSMEADDAQTSKNRPQTVDEAHLLCRGLAGTRETNPYSTDHKNMWQKLSEGEQRPKLSLGQRDNSDNVFWRCMVFAVFYD
jgi:hypothetical protein